MPRISRQAFNIRTVLTGPGRSPAREKELRVVKKIDVSPEIQSLLETPTWSVSQLLPAGFRVTAQGTPTERTERLGIKAQAWRTEYLFPWASKITIIKLRHLLRLSALPPPQSKIEEEKMLKELRDQLHLVREILKVDTTGVEPLVAIRDETAEHIQERTITRETLAEFLALEEKKGRNGTIRRRRDTYLVTSFTEESQPWEEDPLAWSKVKDPWALGEDGDSRKMGRFFFVKRQVPEAEGDRRETAPSETEQEGKANFKPMDMP
ncbi:uncharacterized protein Z520_06923 [Fonsecaea multimorphosa CBS 102226]|uniref:Glutamyl-tRNA amidotransferase complex subunit Gta3 domain-containing protein n=1 Tax=Fonsecaea multimorphosa CBS 102226 TaxID=1442371 RepID=A0A0D2IKC6_9EURO|nr:uncharacterized protein Z520_06923 [Fonsecaea multimorphosa CBS 102226]KIX97471.1 hypothetical protein Z520_06923 [Fonsecaea multimorphosa CBS 102226]OAL23435.1 hypothetical protein AYO22_06485 [Fonsecaea multimorphosa]